MLNENHLFADIPVKALIENEGKILIMLGADDDHWQLPGGRVNEGENLEEALKREIKEELNLDIEPISVFGAFLFKSASGKNHIVLVYKCRVLNNLDEIKFNDGETKEIRWVSVSDFKSLKIRDGYRNELKKFFKPVYQ
ncbi:MAG: NUDIX hydrolase [bacterium]|nr:NUDIX hydrolase [bacterium]